MNSTATLARGAPIPGGHSADHVEEVYSKVAWRLMPLLVICYILYLTFWFPGPRRGQMIAIFMTATSLASIIAGPLCGGIMKWMDGVNGWHWCTSCCWARPTRWSSGCPP